MRHHDAAVLALAAALFLPGTGCDRGREDPAAAGDEPVAREGASVPVREPSTVVDWTAAEELPGYGESEARREAERCLQCGLICYRKMQ